MGEIEPDRNVHCVMGLPIDAVTMDEAVNRVRLAALNNWRCFVSTRNLNFLIASRSDSAFRDSVLHSDLSLADGMPLVWVARLLGVPLRERVSGAGLFERLLAHNGPPLTVYFFGGPEGAAEAASRAVNEMDGGLRCVGFDSPGFGGLEAMSSEEHIARINRSGAMFVIVSLGASKGQRWIELNRHRLLAPVICHLGAVVNFAAGTVQRAPTWMQLIGGEWVWRVIQEPSLWRRYWGDGRAFLAILIREVLPLWMEKRARPSLRGSVEPSVAIASKSGVTELMLTGRWDGDSVEPLRDALNQARRSGDALTIDFLNTTSIGSAALGLLLSSKATFGETARFEVRNASRHISRSITRHGASYLLMVRR